MKHYLEQMLELCNATIESWIEYRVRLLDKLSNYENQA